MASWMAIPKIEMNPIAAETEKFTPVMSSARTPPVHATGMLMRTMIVSTQFFTALYVRKRDEEQRERDDDREPRLGLVQLVDLAAPLEVRVVREAHLRARSSVCASSMVLFRSRPRTENFTGM